MKNDTITKKVCPRCGAEYTAPSALSRIGGETYICPDCGTREALEAMGISEKEQDEIIGIIHAHIAGYEG